MILAAVHIVAYSLNMAHFASWQSYISFSHSVKRCWRYTRDEDTVRFLAAVVSSLDSRIETIPADAQLWRAQLGCIWQPEPHEGEHVTDVPCPFDPVRMKPLRAQATEGRANPKGIPCLYAATHKETAIAEVRPWIGAEVTVAFLTIQHPLRIVNCTWEDKALPIVFFEEPSAADKEAANWRAIDTAFSRPVTTSDRRADYAPTQILAEEFRKRGFDGLAYHSSLGAGHNVALFDLDAAEIRSRIVCRVSSLSIVVKDICSPHLKVES